MPELLMKAYGREECQRISAESSVVSLMRPNRLGSEQNWTELAPVGQTCFEKASPFKVTPICPVHLHSETREWTDQPRFFFFFFNVTTKLSSCVKSARLHQWLFVAWVIKTNLLFRWPKTILCGGHTHRYADVDFITIPPVRYLSFHSRSW